MLDFYQKRKLKGVVLMPVTRLLLLILVLLLAYSAFVRYQIAVEMEERREGAEAEVEELKAQREMLQQKVDYLSTERGIEAELRRQFDATLPGEEVVVILEEEDSELQPLSGTSTEETSPWYIFWD